MPGVRGQCTRHAPTGTQALPPSPSGSLFRTLFRLLAFPERPSSPRGPRLHSLSRDLPSLSLLFQPHNCRSPAHSTYNTATARSTSIFPAFCISSKEEETICGEKTDKRIALGRWSSPFFTSLLSTLCPSHVSPSPDFRKACIFLLFAPRKSTFLPHLPCQSEC